MSYTCSKCRTVRTEEIEYIKDLKVPSVSLSITTNSAGRLIMTGVVSDYENLDDYHEITAHGLLYMQTRRLGSRVLTINTSGRTCVKFSGYKDNGSFVYKLKPASIGTSYTVRAFIAYTDPETEKTVYDYSDTVICSYTSLN